MNSLILSLPTVLHVFLGFGSVALILYLAFRDRKESKGLLGQPLADTEHSPAPEAPPAAPVDLDQTASQQGTPSHLSEEEAQARQVDHVSSERAA